jgi:hypothetical protein
MVDEIVIARLYRPISHLDLRPISRFIISVSRHPTTLIGNCCQFIIAVVAVGSSASLSSNTRPIAGFIIFIISNPPRLVGRTITITNGIEGIRNAGTIGEFSGNGTEQG